MPWSCKIPAWNLLSSLASQKFIIVIIIATSPYDKQSDTGQASMTNTPNSRLCTLNSTYGIPYLKELKTLEKPVP